MRHTHFRAPSNDGALLQVPPLSEASGHFRENLDRLGRWSIDLQGRRTDVLRVRAREELIDAAREYHAQAGLDPVPATPDLTRVVATGHQPELFHPGVWVKNFALAAIAQRSNAVGINLIVDNDIPKGAVLRVPTLRDQRLVREPLAFDSWPGEVPYEAQNLVDHDRFASFGARVSEALDGLIEDPLVRSFWPIVLDKLDAPALQTNVGLRFASARRLVEASWGIHNVEVPLSRVCETDAFRWFACHLLANLEKFRERHNSALFAYRKMYRIRSKNHPVAELKVDPDGWQEAPFWIWRDSSPRRHGLWVRTVGQSMDLRIGGEEGPFLQIPLGKDRDACCAVEALRGLPDLGIRLRTRALTTTMFARLFLSDLFIHGIGGAKYDELGDEIVRGFYQIEPPRFMTLSLTLHAGLPSTGIERSDLLRVDRTLRESNFTPDRFLETSPDPEVQRLIEAKRASIAAPVETRRDRVNRYFALRQINEQLQPALAGMRETLEQERRRISDGLKREAIARSREFSSIVHSEARLRSVLTNLSSEFEDSGKNRRIPD